ncbi:zeaxanthin epoxidase, chloroplastic [Dorcoceras hygrometricum]|uniref:Zeaxanthin epoxidase, chloroplastic n=1 Tax=Dorcoceras hygrometricum TaxID=472368 RepID=A0A2Z7BEM1_9LAMI|nr:zeaxanthin epoxidase, chloroplastic [Dorcoceras hygrometricum]
MPTTNNERSGKIMKAAGLQNRFHAKLNQISYKQISPTNSDFNKLVQQISCTMQHQISTPKRDRFHATDLTRSSNRSHTERSRFHKQISPTFPTRFQPLSATDFST